MPAPSASLTPSLWQTWCQWWSDPPESHPPPISAWGSLGRYAFAIVLGIGAISVPRAASAGWVVGLDLGAGLVAVLLMRLRRRWPLQIALLTTALSAFSLSAAGAAWVAMLSMTTRRRPREITMMAPLFVAANLINAALHRGPSPFSLTLDLLSALAGLVITLAVGYAIGSRRELLASLRERAETNEREQAAREDAARTQERNRIAREMHDVLAHRISLVAMHAGVLTYRSDLSAQEQTTAAKTIEENAHLALEELRGVLGVLRATPGGPDRSAPEQPQPTLTDLPELIAAGRSAGDRIDLVERTHGAPPRTLGRTAYRIVQEGLTNARKHAPGALVRVALSGNPTDGLSIEVHNGRSLRASPSPIVGAGVGLIGLRERVELAGGRMSTTHGPDGSHLLAVWLPWSM